jgi:hypothetical protein
MKLTREEIMAKKTPAGGWTKETLAQWGVSWPPPKGWIDLLCSDETEPDEIHKMICLSTSHVCGDTALKFQNANKIGSMPVFYDKREYGWFVHVSTDSEPDELAQYPEDVQGVLAYARTRGCGWVMLDSDGPVVEGLPTWEW